ncbi:MAG: hypothetical protein FJ386_00660 [Verrucomicrobia bacterium]|nr:hypothetical protein [Verrucomicrobiota bacterium]
MKLRAVNPAPTRTHRAERASVLVIVLWIAFGLVTLALYFAQSSTLELRAADNRTATVEAGQAIAGAARYVNYILANQETNGFRPDPQSYESEAVPIGDATFWILGRGDDQVSPDRPVFGLVDEASKLNLNTATLEMLQALPKTTAEFSAATVDWRDEDSTVTEGGAEDEIYGRLNPAYRCKNGRFESIEELRLVYGATLAILYGEDVNMNGVLDPNENDGDNSLPGDDRNGVLDLGVLEYVTVHSREPNTRSDGSQRINVNPTQGGQQQGGGARLQGLLNEKFGETRAQEIMPRISGPGANFGSLLEFYLVSQMTADEFAQIHSDLTTTNATSIEGRVNVNTASEAVLKCIPGIGADNAGSLVSFRQANPSRLDSIAWVSEVLEREDAVRAGPFLTAQSYQFSADIVALGHHARGYQRVKFIFDTSSGTPRIVHRQDLTHFGWALGPAIREQARLAKELR